MQRSAIYLFAAALGLLARAAGAEPPQLAHLFPAGAERGTTITLAVGGKNETWPVKVWCDDASIVFAPTETKGEIKVQIPAAAALGPHLIRLYHGDGATAPRTFIVDSIPDSAEAEPNDDYRAPQKLGRTPAAVNGRLEKQGDVDSFAIDLKAGQWLVAKAEAYGIGSMIDPSLHVRDSRGHRLADAFDTQNLDPLLAFQAKEDGTYILQIDAFAHIPRFDVRLYGSPGSVYRLSIFTGPFARYAYPLAIAAGAEAEVRLHGWNLPLGEGGPPSVRLSSPARSALELRRQPFAPVENAIAENRVAVALRSAPQSLEAEANNARDAAQKLARPGGVSGRICPAKDEDWFALDFKKGESAKFTLASASLGFDLDPVLNIVAADGKTLASGDDANNSWDPEIAWTAPEDGTYYAQIADRYGAGADDFVYRFEVADLAPRAEATVEKHTLRLDAGTTATIKVTVSRIDGHKTPLIAAAVDLPEGVTASSAAVPEAGGDATLTFAAAPQAKPFNGLFRVMLLSTVPESPEATAAEASLDVELPVGKQIVQRTEKLWITVVEKKPEPPKEAAPAPAPK